MRKYIFVILTVLSGCYSVADDLYIESEPVELIITTNTAYRVDVNYYYDPPYSIKTPVHNFYYESNVDNFYDNVEIGVENAINHSYFSQSDSVELYVYAVDKRGGYTAPIYRWRGTNGKINTQRGYVYKEILK